MSPRPHKGGCRTTLDIVVLRDVGAGFGRDAVSEFEFFQLMCERTVFS